MISPHFPPDATAAAHRVRVLAPALASFGWRPTILTVDPREYEGQLDEELAAALPADLDVVRCPAWPHQTTRRFGVGDLGLRALSALRRAAAALVADRGIDVVFITTYPTYPALIGPWLKRTRRLPFVLDLQDPWVGAWGLTVGGGDDGSPDLRSRVSRAVTSMLERHVVPHADAVTGVSSTLLEELAARYPVLAGRPRATLPIGMNAADLDWARAHPRPAPWLPPQDGRLHLCYAGTLLPLGVDTVRALFTAIAAIRAADPARVSRLHLHFIGTSNQARADAEGRVSPLARQFGIEDLVTEHAPRVPFMDALRALLASGAVLLLGTTEARYTASKLHIALASGRPILAVFHDQSDVTRALRPIADRDPAMQLIAYGDADPVANHVDRIRGVLDAWLKARPPAPRSRAGGGDVPDASSLAGQLAGIFDRVVSHG